MEYRISVLGGCHVSGYPNNPAWAFPLLLRKYLPCELVAQVPHVQFVKLPEHLAALDALQPSHVVLQLGNYEFSASLRQLLRQFSPSARLLLKKSDVKVALAQDFKRTPHTVGMAHYPRVAAVSLLTVVLWFCSPRHRRSRRILNAYILARPATKFVFLSPFPCLAPSDNAVRRFGGWVLRNRVANLHNCQWVNSHHLLPLGPQLFADPWHLNEEGHALLANGVAVGLALAVGLAG